MNNWTATLLVVLLGAGSQLCAAADNQSGHYDLYSWKEGNEWDFSLLPASKERPVDVEIKQRGGPLRGEGKVKEKLIDMKEGDTISWQERADRGMVYPPDFVIQDINAYAQAVGVHLVVPEKVTHKP